MIVSARKLNRFSRLANDPFLAVMNPCDYETGGSPLGHDPVQCPAELRFNRIIRRYAKQPGVLIAKPFQLLRISADYGHFIPFLSEPQTSA